MCSFLAEAAALDGCGARLDTVLSHVQNNWGGYAPELRVVRTQIEDPSDMDAVGAPITEAVAALTAEFPDGEVLLNLSSGYAADENCACISRCRSAAQYARYSGQEF